MKSESNAIGKRVRILTPYSYYRDKIGEVVDQDEDFGGRYCVTIGAHKRMWFPKHHCEFVKEQNAKP